MGKVLGTIWEFIPLVAGTYLILIYGNVIKPKFKSDEREIKFQNQKSKFGRWFVVAGVIMVISSVYTIFKILA